MSSKPPRDPALIRGAPVKADEGGPEDAALSAMASSFAAQLESARAEIVRLEGKKTVDDVRAEILAEFSGNTFRFVVWYCVIVGVLLGLAGWKSYSKFELSDTILGIIAGSTAVSVIGLIGMVVTGLFGRAPKASPAKKKAASKKAKSQSAAS